MQAGIPAWLNALLAIGGLGTLVSGLALWFKHWRDSNIAEKKDGREANRDSVETFTAWREEAIASSQEASRLAREMSSMRTDIEGLLSDVAELSARVGTLEDSEQRLIGWVSVLHAGVEAGTIPPLPEVPPQILAVISRIEKE